jgi:hypothetical protein
VYADDIPFKFFFTGTVNFTVKEIKVFKITDSRTLPADVERSANGC